MTARGRSTIELSCQTLAITFTGLDIRQPVFQYYHQLEESETHLIGIEHGQPLVTKIREGSHYVTLRFPDLPVIFCLDEPHGRFRGVPVETAVAQEDPSAERQIWMDWHAEHFITATWIGSMVTEFVPLWRRLIEMLGPAYASVPVRQDAHPYGSPEDLVRIGRLLAAWPDSEGHSASS